LPSLGVQSLDIWREIAPLKLLFRLLAVDQARLLRLDMSVAVVFGHRDTLSQATGAFNDLFLNFGDDDLKIEISYVRPPQALNAIKVITEIFERLRAGDFFPDLPQLVE
jgi:hypothetical protein